MKMKDLMAWVQACQLSDVLHAETNKSLNDPNQSVAMLISITQRSVDASEIARDLTQKIEYEAMDLPKAQKVCMRSLIYRISGARGMKWGNPYLFEKAELGIPFFVEQMHRRAHPICSHCGKEQ